MKLTDKETVNDNRLVAAVVRKFARSHVSEQDLHQEGMLALIKARTTFNPDAGVKFETYASRVITNRIIDVLRKQRDAAPGRFAGSETSADQIPADFSMENEVNLLEVKRFLRERCTEIERAVFNSYIEGFSYSEIGKIFELTPKKIDNIIQKVKRLIKSFD